MRKWDIRQISVSYCENTVLFASVRNSGNGVLCQQFVWCVLLGGDKYVHTFLKSSAIATLLSHFFLTKCEHLSGPFYSGKWGLFTLLHFFSL